MDTPTRRRGRPAGSQGDELLAVAREVFCEVGFPGTTMGEVAARARISKASLYREHASKDALFSAVVLDWAARGRGAMAPVLDGLRAAPDVRAGLLDLVRTVQTATLDSAVARMRRLVAAESDRFPDVAASYVADSWDGNIAALAATLAELPDLDIDDPALAANQLTWLAIGGPLNAQTLRGADAPLNPDQLAAAATGAVDTFLARYGRR